MEGGSCGDVSSQPNKLDLSASPSSTETSEPLTAHVEGNIDVDAEANPDPDTSCVSDDEGDAHMFGQLHPLHSPVILQHLFQLCSPSILAQCRLVCKQWKELSLASWRSSFFLTFTWTNRIISFNGGPPFQRFLEYVQDPNNNCSIKPFRKIELDRWNFRPHRDTERFNQFWNSVGGALTSLYLDRCKFTDVEELRGLVSQRCPNLSHLTLANVKLTSSSHPKSSGHHYFQTGKAVNGKPSSVKSLELSLAPCQFTNRQHVYSFDVLLELLSHFSSLNSFQLRSSQISTVHFHILENELLAILNIIKMIRTQDGRKLPLQRFESDVPLEISSDPASQDKFALVEELKLPLQNISIAVDSTLENDRVEKVLQHHSETLRFIRFRGRGRLPCSCLVPIPVGLVNLKHLWLFNVSIPNLSFLRLTPNLEGFRIGGKRGRIFTNRKTRMVSNSRKIIGLAEDELKLLKLSSFHFGYILDAAELAWLGRILPNVENLRIYLSDKLFPIVCQHWRNIKELTVLGKDLSDAGVIGGQGRMEGGQPSIISLQGLEVFRFDSRNLTDVSLYYGFLALPKLKKLWTLSREGKEFGEEAVWCLEEERSVTLRRDDQAEENEEEAGDYSGAFELLYAFQ